MTYKEDNPGGYPGPPAPPEYQYHYCDLCGDELTEENTVVIGPPGTIGYQVRYIFFPKSKLKKPEVNELDICSKCTTDLLKKQQAAAKKIEKNWKAKQKELVRPKLVLPS